MQMTGLGINNNVYFVYLEIRTVYLVYFGSARNERLSGLDGRSTFEVECSKLKKRAGAIHCKTKVLADPLECNAEPVSRLPAMFLNRDHRVGVLSVSASLP
jgi:hypothetical protein